MRGTSEIIFAATSRRISHPIGRPGASETVPVHRNGQLLGTSEMLAQGGVPHLLRRVASRSPCGVPTGGSPGDHDSRSSNCQCLIRECTPATAATRVCLRTRFIHETIILMEPPFLLRLAFVRYAQDIRYAQETYGMRRT